MGGAFNIDVEQLAVIGCQVDFDATFGYEALSLLYRLGGAVFKDFKLVGTFANEGAQGYCNGETGHAGAGNSDAHGVLEHIGAEFDVDFFGADAEGLCGVRCAKGDGYGLGAAHCRHDFFFNEVDNLGISHSTQNYEKNFAVHKNRLIFAVPMRK